jgi:all-trans-retinol 13,14-reductase
LRECIKSYTTSSPLTYRDYIGAKDGGLYGIAKDYKDPLRTFISPKTKIPNLLFTGQNLNMHGVLGVTVGAIRTCGEFVGTNQLIRKINQS